MAFIIQDVRLFDGESVSERQSVLVEDGVIKQVGAHLDKPGVPVISKPGHTLLPGLIDAHSHPYREVGFPEQAFRFGVTTLLDMQNLHENAQQLKQWAKERKDFPDIKSCHFSATIAGGWPSWIEKKINNEVAAKLDEWPNIAKEEDAEPYIQQALADGADYIKLMHESGTALGIEGMAQPSQAVQAAVVKAAHKHGFKVVAHALCLKDTLEVLRAGADGLTHTFYDKPITPEVIEAYKANNAWLNPTLIAVGSLTGESKEIMEFFSKDERVRSRASTDSLGLMHRCLHLTSPGAKWEYAIDSVRQLKAAGIDIICGSDAATGAPGSVFGFNLHLEMYLLVEKAGLSPLETLRGATSLTAKRFGWADRGSIAPGLKADLLLVEGNPLNDITDLLNIRGIWRDGVRFTGHPGFPQE
ncbi:composite domain of metallo-dependent hydrolase [Whalleya microplaca]|nr:composite domain of metallo-dependent hydrolase [Whalleya microplaca]